MPDYSPAERISHALYVLTHELPITTDRHELAGRALIREHLTMALSGLGVEPHTTYPRPMGAVPVTAEDEAAYDAHLRREGMEPAPLVDDFRRHF